VRVKALIRLFIVLNLAAALVALVRYLERWYAPHTPDQWQRAVAAAGVGTAPEGDPWWSESSGTLWVSSLGFSEGAAGASSTAANLEPVSAPGPDGKTDRDATGLLAIPQLRTDSQPHTAAAGEPPLPAPMPGTAPEPLPAGSGVEAASLGPTDHASTRAAALLRRLQPRATGEEDQETVANLQGIDSFELMRQWQQADPAAAAQVGAELRRRGFTEVHLELTRGLFDPNPAVRKALARALPRLQSVDAAPWLLHLSHDEDAEVRLTAVTLIGTTGDPNLLEQVEAAARQDSDPRVRDQAENIARQRGVVGTRGAGGSGRRR
jgi:hypothetical protein